MCQVSLLAVTPSEALQPVSLASFIGQLTGDGYGFFEAAYSLLVIPDAGI
jgi:hypothetical protein